MMLSNAAAVCFALFVFAGYFKAADFLQFMPIDLTLLFAGGTSAFCCFAVWRTRALGPGVVPMVAVFAVLLTGFHWPENFSSYATQKELRLFSITALSALAPLILLRTATQRQTFANAVCLLGLVMAAIVAVEAARHGLSPRARAFNANPILLARASGFAGIVLCLHYWQGRLSIWIFAPAALIALVGLLASGTKAPLLGVLLAVFATALLAVVNGAARHRIWGTLTIGFLGLVGALAYLAWTGVFVARRIVAPLAGEWASTGELRKALWRQTVELIPTQPFGVGWGRFNEWVQVIEGGNLLLHPHNIVLEILVEAGWLAGAAFLALAGVSLYRSVRAAYRARVADGGTATGDLLLVSAGLMYWLVCAAFSGDVNDNRPLWALLGMALAALGSRKVTRSDGLESTVEVGDTRKPLTGA